MATTPYLGITELLTGQAQKENTISTGVRELEAAMAGALAKNVGGSANVTLTRTEALNAFYVFSGALTGNIQVRWPASGGTARNLRVYNNTTGAFTLTLVVAGGSGVAITQGEIRDFVIDGTTVRPTNATAGTYTQASAQAIWARVFHNANQSIANTTPAALAFNSERADTDTIHDNVTNNSRLTCKTAGVYAVSANVEWTANATGYRELFLLINGVTRFADNVAPPVTTGVVTRQQAQGIYALAVNDYVEAWVNQSSGVALNIITAANYSPEFMMVRLGGS